MRLLIFLALLSSLLPGSTILSYNIYERTDRVDIMFTFDTPYDGLLRQSRRGEQLIVTLEEAVIDAAKVRSVRSPLLSNLTIAPLGDNTRITATIAPSVRMEASKTSDAFGLRLRFKGRDSAPSRTAEAETEAIKAPEGLPTKPEGEFDGSYMVVITILVIGIAILLWLRNRLPQTPLPGLKTAWPLVKKGRRNGDTVKVRFQKPLDPKNRIVMLEYETASYLLLIGTSNLLLEKFEGNRPVTEEEFEAVLQNKHEALDTFLRLDTQKEEPLQSYKEKASGIDPEAT